MTKQAKTRRSGKSSSAVEHELSTHGGKRLGAGSPESNTNAQKKLPLPECLNLESPEGVRKFLREIVVPSAISGKLGVRVISAVTTACKVLLDSEQAAILEELEGRLEKLEKERGSVAQQTQEASE